jgi:spermidine dehydrogenase
MARLQTSFLSTEEREVLHEQTLTVLEELGVAVQVPEALALNPDSPWVSYWTDYPVSMGGYRYPMDLDEPGLIHMTGALCKRGLSPREGGRVGRQELYKMPFADLERGLRELLARTLDAGGFDPARDIQAVTVNRWAHGYSIEYVSPWDNEFYPDGPLPGEAASTPFGRITFAGTDRSSRAYMDSAFDAAISAVNELT